MGASSLFSLQSSAINWDFENLGESLRTCQVSGGGGGGGFKKGGGGGGGGIFKRSGTLSMRGWQYTSKNTTRNYSAFSLMVSDVLKSNYYLK